MSSTLEDIVGYRFQDRGLLQEALTHKSYAYERGNTRHNERLEFLGDSVLAAVVAHRLFERFPESDEGRLSKARALIVSRNSLAHQAAVLELGRFLLLGSGEESTGGRTRPSLLANALEAVIGAVYLDGGFDASRRVIERCTLDLEASDGAGETDYKSRLQEIVQKRHKAEPCYRLVKTSGPDHDKTFQVKALFGSRTLGTGRGKTKKDAEQDAARDALERMGQQ